MQVVSTNNSYLRVKKRSLALVSRPKCDSFSVTDISSLSALSSLLPPSFSLSLKSLLFNKSCLVLLFAHILLDAENLPFFFSFFRQSFLTRATLVPDASGELVTGKDWR